MKRKSYCKPATRYLESDTEYNILTSTGVTEEVPVDDDGENDIELDSKMSNVNVWDD